MRPGLERVGDFDQVAIRIAQINGTELSNGSLAINRTFFNMNFLFCQIFHNFV